MLERITFALEDQGLCGALFRYDLLARAGEVLARQGCALLAWGFGPDGLRLVAEGDEDALTLACRGLCIGTTHAARAWGLWGRGEIFRDRVVDLFEAVAWAHAGPVDAGAAGPLASPWSSHRDLMRFRKAGFYDAAVLDHRVDPRALHERLGGEALPDGWPPPPGAPESLTLLLRIAGAVLGVLPADPRCFRLFVHLARARGWSTRPLADALALTKRRVRQLASAPEPDLELAMAALADPRLACVP